MRFEAKGPPQHAIQFCWRNGSNHPQSFEPIGFVSQTTAPRPSVAPYGSNIAVTDGSAAVEATSPWSQRREQLHCSPWLVLQARVAASDPQCSAPAERCVELKGGRFSRAGLLLLCLLLSAVRLPRVHWEVTRPPHSEIRFEDVHHRSEVLFVVRPSTR